MAIDAALENKNIAATNQSVDSAIASIEKLKTSVQGVIFGQENVIDLCLCALLGGSHALLVGMPGLAKTLLVETIAKSCGLGFNRVQFTPDLMPSDILGSEVLETDDKGGRNFRFINGPVFTQILMADEINRASPKTQAALLQAMQERKVAINGINHDLPKPFHVLATQNPIEHEGAYPLPEAQLDRFLLEINVPYPDEEAEKQVLINTTGTQSDKAFNPLDSDELLALQALVRSMPTSEKIIDKVLNIVRNLRPQTTKFEKVKTSLEWGPSPRAGQAIILAAKSHALLRGHLAPTLEDVNFVAKSALNHRMSLNWNGRSSGASKSELIDMVFDD